MIFSLRSLRFQALFSLRGRRTSPRPTVRRVSCRPSLESLEQRMVPSQMAADTMLLPAAPAEPAAVRQGGVDDTIDDHGALDAGGAVDDHGALDDNGTVDDHGALDDDNGGLDDHGADDVVHYFATGTDAGGGPNVLVFDADSGRAVFNFFAYDPRFTGGVRVALGDVNDDRVPDIVTAPGPGGGPDIKVFDGKTGGMLRQFFAFDPAFAGGLYVAVGDNNGDGFDDVLVGADAGGGPNVAVFDGKSIAGGQPIAPLADFFPYDSHFTGGVRVAAGDVDGDGHDDIICGAGTGGGPNVSVISGADDKTLVKSFFAYGAEFTGGVYVATGDVDGDGHDDIVCGAGAGGGPNVSVYSGAAGSLLSSFFPYDDHFHGGVRVGAVDRDGDGKADVQCGPGPGGGPDVRSVDGESGKGIDDFFAYSDQYSAGLFVGGSHH